MATIKKLNFASGTDVTAPTDLSFESSTKSLEPYVDDAAYVAANGAANNGDGYINTTLNVVRYYSNGSWRSSSMSSLTETLTNKTIDGSSNTISNLTSAMITGVIATSKGGTGVNSTATFPASGVVVTESATADLLNKRVSSTSAITGAQHLASGTTAERPGTPVDGMFRYNTDLSTFEGYASGNWGAIGGGGSGAVLGVNQTAHGFVAGDALYITGSNTFTKAKADAANTAEVVGVVSLVVGANDFQLTTGGLIAGLSGLTPGANYFLSAVTAGLLTVNEPTTIGYVSVPVGVAKTATEMVVNIMRGVVVGGANARTSIALANNATTTIQSLAAYEAAELTGWVSIAATTPLKFYVQAQVAKNGAGTDYNLSYQTTGDTPPVGFNVTVTAAGLVQVVMPNVTGFTSASINYALNAPAVGTTFPLSVDASSVVGTLVKTQLKTLPSTIAGSNAPTTPNSDLSFNNLVAGKVYRVDACFETDTGGGQIWFLWGLGSNNTHYRYVGTPIGSVTPVSFMFTAVNTTLSVYLGNASANYRATDGNSTPTAITGGLPKVTWVQLSELSNVTTTTAFT